MTKDAEKLLKYIGNEAQKCNDTEVTVDLNKIKEIPDIKFLKNALLDELRILGFIRDYDENIFDELKVYLTSKGADYLSKQQKFVKILKKFSVFIVDGGQINFASGNMIINSYHDIHHDIML